MQFNCCEYLLQDIFYVALPTELPSIKLDDFVCITKQLIAESSKEETSGIEPEPFFAEKVIEIAVRILYKITDFVNATLTPRSRCLFFKVSLRFFRVSDLSFGEK